MLDQGKTKPKKATHGQKGTGQYKETGTRQNIRKSNRRQDKNKGIRRSNGPSETERNNAEQNKGKSKKK